MRNATRGYVAGLAAALLVLATPAATWAAALDPVMPAPSAWADSAAAESSSADWNAIPGPRLRLSIFGDDAEPGSGVAATAAAGAGGGLGEAPNPMSWRLAGGFGAGVVTGGLTLGVGVLLIRQLCDGSLGCIGLGVLAMMASYAVYVVTVPVGVRFGGTFGTGLEVPIWPPLLGSLAGGLLGALLLFATTPVWDGLLLRLSEPTGVLLSATFALTLLLLPPVAGAAIGFQVAHGRRATGVGAVLNVDGGRLLAGIPVPHLVGFGDARTHGVALPLVAGRF